MEGEKLVLSAVEGNPVSRSKASLKNGAFFMPEILINKKAGSK